MSDQKPHRELFHHGTDPGRFPATAANIAWLRHHKETDFEQSGAHAQMMAILMTIIIAMSFVGYFIICYS